MEQAERERAVEAILFALGEPVPTARLAQALDAEEDQVFAACQDLAAFYETQARGIRLVQLEESWQLVSAPRWGAVIRGLLARKKPDKLSASALETLALVAYFQPVTRVYLDQARGVDSAHSLSPEHYCSGITIARTIICSVSILNEVLSITAQECPPFS